MQGHINTTFGTYQTDLFESGLVAEIGTNAFAIWCAIKWHSDFNNGVSYPSIRRLMAKTGLASATVQKALKNLEEFHLLRSWVKNRKRYYVARERLDVKIGNRTLCTVVVDYIPATLRKQLHDIKSALETGNANPLSLANAEIIPGPGFSWDAPAGVLRAAIPASEIAANTRNNSSDTPNPYEQQINEIAQKALSRRKLLKT